MTDTVSLTDRLPEIVQDAFDSVISDVLENYFIENFSDGCPSISDLDDDGSIHDIIDRAVPIYHSQLNELAYFHHDSAMEALEQEFGSCDGEYPLGKFAAGLYVLIQQGVYEQFDQEASDIWDKWEAEMLTSEFAEMAIKNYKGKQSTK